MNKKDRTIESILARYAKEVGPDPSLLDDARAAAREKAPAGGGAAAKKPPVRHRFALLGAVAASVAIFVVSVFAMVNLLPKLGGGSGGNSSPSPDPPPVTEYYRETDLIMRSVTKAEAAAAGEIKFLESEDLLGEEYKLFSFKEDGTPAFVMGRLRVKSARGVDDVTVVAEVTDKVIKNFADYVLLAETNLGRGETVYDRETGEYVTYAYRRDQAVKYYLYVLSPTGRTPDDYLTMLK